MCSRRSLRYAKKRQSYEIERILAAKAIEAAPEEAIGEAAKSKRKKPVGYLMITPEDTITGIAADRDFLFPFTRMKCRLASCVHCRGGIVQRNLPFFYGSALFSRFPSSVVTSTGVPHCLHRWLMSSRPF